MEINALHMFHVHKVKYGIKLSLNAFVHQLVSGMEILVFYVEEIKLIQMVDVSVHLEVFITELDVYLKIQAVVLVFQIPTGMELHVFASKDSLMSTEDVLVKDYLLELFVIDATQNQIQLLLMEYVNVIMDTSILMEPAFYQLPSILIAMQELISIIKLKDVYHAQMDVSDVLLVMPVLNVDLNTLSFHLPDFANKFAETDLDSPYHVMMETMLMVMDVASLAKLK